MSIDITTIGIEYDTSGLEKGTRAQDKTTESANKMGDSVKKSSDKAKESLGGLGKESETTSQKFDKSTQAIIDSIKKTTAQMEAGTKTGSKYYESLINQKGINGSALKPYIDQLKELEKQQAKVGVSAAQTAAAMRGVPAQFTDIVTSIQGGQAPLTVLLQQGGQLKDMFGGAGNAARALGSYIFGLINPFTVLAAVVGGLGIIYAKSGSEAKEFAKSLIQTNSASGETVDSLRTLSATYVDLGVTSRSVANETLNALVSSGKVANDMIERTSFAAIRSQEFLGTAVADTAKEFADLGKAPTAAVEKLNEKYNFLTMEIYNQIKAYEDQGRVADAARIAQSAYADALLSQSDKVQATLTDWERGWIRIKNATSGAFSAVMTMFDDPTMDQQIAKLFKVRDELEKSQKQLQGDNSFLNKGAAERVAQQLEQNKIEINQIRDKIKAKKDEAEAEAKKNATVLAGIEFTNISQKYLDKEAKLQLEINRIKTVGAAAGKTQAEIENQIAKAREANAEKTKKIHADERYSLSIEKQLNKELNDSKMYGLRMELKIIDEINKESKKERDDTKKWMQDQRDNYASANKSLDDYAQRMAETNELAQMEIDLLGLSSVERNTLIEQKKIQIALERELAKLKDMNLTDEKRQELIDKATTQANIDKSTAQLRAQQGEWTKFYSEIYNGLSDSLYRGFEAGKGFGKSFLDSIKNLFKTNVLKIMVQAVMGGAGGMVSSMASAMSGGGESGGAGSYISMGKSIYEGFSSGFTGFGDSVANYVQAGLDKAGLSMTGGGNSALASGAGTAASYLGGAAVGIYGGRAISGGYSVTGGNAAVNIGTLAGAIFGGPIGAAIGGLIGGGVNRLFGRKAAELQSSELTGSVGASGFSASTKDTYLAKGGFFRSDKWSSTTTAMTDTSGLTKEYEAIKAAATGYASMLGLSSAAVDSYTKTFNISLSKTGDAAKDAEENEKKLKYLFLEISNDITNLIAPSIVALSKDGETTAQTLGRLAIGLTSVNGIMNAAGFAEFAKSLEGASAANRLAELTGGIENLSAGTQFFVENFLNEAEKIKPIADQVSATMARLGQSSVDTIPEFKQLVQGLDLTSEAEAKMYAELIAIAPQFKAIADSKAAEEMQKLSEATRELELASQKAKAIADERKSLQDEYNSLTMSSTELFAQYKNSLDVSNQSLAESIQAIKDKTAAEESAAAKAASIATERKTLQDEYNSLTMTAVQLMAQYRNGLDESNQALYDQINVIKAAREKALAEEKAVAEALAAAQKEASDIAAERATLQDEYNRLTMTEIELMGLKRATLKESNRDLFDLINAEKARREESAKAEAALKASESEWAQSMKAAFDSQTGALKNIISEFGTLAKTLQDYSRSLTVGEAAKLSPETRYKLLGEEINALMPQVKAKDKDALAKWAKVSEEYLKASEGNFATSVGYFKDLELIKTYTDEAAQYAQSQVDVAQLQLNAMTNSVDAINGVNQSVQQVLQAITGAASGSGSSGAEMGLVAGYQANVLRNVENLGGLENLYQGAISGNPDAYRNLKGQMQRWAQMGLDKNALDTILGAGWYDKLKAIPGFANGGVANGLAMVGERGPELVNFKSPARVYNANDTQSIIGGSNSKETNDLLKKQNLLIEKLIYKLEGASEKQVKAVGNVAQKIGAIDANVKFEKAGT